MIYAYTENGRQHQLEQDSPPDVPWWICFDPGPHTYQDSDGVYYKSVTAWLGEIDEHPFDADVQAERCAQKLTGRYAGMTPQEIKARWDNTSEVGSELHALVEAYIKTGANADHPCVRQVAAWLAANRSEPRSEVLLWSRRYKMAGTCDVWSRFVDDVKTWQEASSHHVARASRQLSLYAMMCEEMGIGAVRVGGVLCFEGYYDLREKARLSFIPCRDRRAELMAYLRVRENKLRQRNEGRKTMGIFHEATNQSAYLKMGFLGFGGSGKTYTAIETAIGLAKHIGTDKPIAFLDTETGSDWAIPRCKAEGIKLLVSKTRAFSDLLDGIRESEAGASVLIIDSVTHFWTEMVDAYKRANGIGEHMGMTHWAKLKPQWQEFSSAYINSKLHIIVCGRAGWEWGHEQDEDGNKELRKLGTKMKVEGEFGFEPSLLVEMERVRDSKVGAGIVHRATVIKDRRMDDKSLDGKSFDNPTFAVFMPHIECLNLGGEHVGIDESRNSQDMFRAEGESFASVRKRATVLVEEIEGELTAHYPGRSEKDKLAKMALKKKLLGTYSDSEIADAKPEVLKTALEKLREVFAREDWADVVDVLVASLTAAAEKAKATKAKKEKGGK